MSYDSGLRLIYLEKNQVFIGIANTFTSVTCASVPNCHPLTLLFTDVHHLWYLALATRSLSLSAAASAVETL